MQASVEEIEDEDETMRKSTEKKVESMEKKKESTEKKKDVPKRRQVPVRRGRTAAKDSKMPKLEETLSPTRHSSVKGPTPEIPEIYLKCT